MKKLLFIILLFFVGMTFAFAQAPTHEQLTYQTVVRNAQNQLVFNQDNVTVKVYVCSDAAGSNVVYSETHTGLSTNANGMLSMMIGSVAPDEGTWAGIDWSTAYIKTTISYNPGSGTVTITHDPAPVTAVPYALSAGNTSNITNLIGDAIHDSIVNNISEQIHDSIVDALGDYQIQNCDDVNDCVATAIADGNSDINHAIDTVVLNNIGDAIHDSIVNNINNNVSEQIHDSIVNNINTTINQQIHDSIVNNINNNISEQIHDSIVDALGDYQIQNCDDVNDCVATAIADGNSDINHAIDTVVLNNIGDAIHDSIVNNISEQIHDSITNYLTVGDYVTGTDLCTTIETNCTNVALRNGNTFTGEHHFTGADSVTVPDAITPDLATALASPCTQEAVNLCDLLAVFDSLNRRIQELADDLDELKNAIPPVANAPTVSNVTSTSMNVKANAISQGAAITSYEFCISTNSDMSGATCQTVLASDADNYTFTGLDPNTNYYVQYSATNFAGTTTSPTVQERTLAHAPTADVTPPAPIKPAGFDVHVDDVDPKEKDEATVQVCYVLKGSGDCPEKESPSYSACTDPVTVTDGGSAIISQTGLEASTEYCVIVKVSNGDSTTIYGPFTVITGADVTMTVANDGGGTVNLCGESTKDVTFTATITGDNASDFTYAWSNGTSTTSKDTVALAAGTHTITVTATHTTEGYTLTATTSTTVNSGGTPISIGFCENEGIVSVKSVSGAPNSIDWGDGQSGTSVSLSTTHDYAALGNGNHEVTITASNAAGCTLSRTMTVTIASTVADRTVKPCTVDPAHAAQTDSAYMGNGHSGANHGLETVNGSGKITSVTDYDGNEYPVVQIGSQCWMAENLRVSHSPKTGSNIVVTAVNNYGSKMAAWYNNDQSTYEAKRYGLLYNWCAAMDTANPSGYVEVATAANTSNQFSFTPSGNHQGVCPIGWHVPTDAEWNAMELEVNGSDVSGSTGYRGSHAGKLSTGCDWSSSSTENAAGNYANAERNDSGFSAVPAGSFNGSFYKPGNDARFWSATQNSNTNAWRRYLIYSNAGVSRSSLDKYYGFSVRCVRDTAVLSVSAASGTVNLCGETTAEAAFTATPSSGNASDFTYTWSTGATASGNTATYSLAAGIHTVYVTATHTTESYTLTGTASVTIASGGTAATLKLCEDPSIGKVLVDNTNCTSLSWKNSSNVEVSTSLTELAVGGGITAGVYTVTGVNASGCSITKQVVLGNYSPRPCTSSSMGSHSAQTTGIGNATDGMETVESGNIISVKDYDGNEYPVVEIGSQCWTAVNMRATHYADGSDVPAGTTSNSSTTAPYYYDHSSSSIPLVQRGYIYNWPAAMKSTNTEGTQGVCPTGWHVPTRADWQTMVAAADAATLTGAVYLSSSCYWNGSTSGTGGMTPNSYDNPERNKSVFSAVPAGFFSGASFNYSGDRAYFCSSSQNAGSSWWHRYLNYNSTQVLEDVAGKGNGYSVRCVRD